VVYNILKKDPLVQGGIYRGGDKENDGRQSQEISGIELISELLSQSFYDPMQPSLIFSYALSKMGHKNPCLRSHLGDKTLKKRHSISGARPPDSEIRFGHEKICLIEIEGWGPRPGRARLCI